jgi:hypothetical protein
MTERDRFEIDEPLAGDDILRQAIDRLPPALPARDLWPRVQMRIAPRRRTVTFTLPGLALAASLLVAVSGGVSWLLAHRAAALPTETPIVAQVESAPGANVQPANFADAQFDRAVSDLEHVLESERETLDPRTVIVIERNLHAIDEAIRQARQALDQDPANLYLNSHLADARRRKLDLLRRVAQLSSTGGD